MGDLGQSQSMCKHVNIPVKVCKNFTQWWIILQQKLQFQHCQYLATL